MPRGLTEEEKEYQKQVLLQHGRRLIFRYGFNRVSIDDIVREAGVAKGTFYHFFASKDDFLYEIVYQFHTQGFTRITAVIKEIKVLPSQERREKIREFFKLMFHSDEQIFFAEQHDEIQRFLMRYSKSTLAELKEMELKSYQALFDILEIKKEKNIEIVQNFVHISFLGISHREMMIKEYLDQTIDVMVEGLLEYLEV